MTAAPARISPPIPKSTLPAALAGAEVAPEAAAVLAELVLAVEAPVAAAPVEAPVFRAVLDPAEVDMLIEPVELAVVVTAAATPDCKGD